MERAEVERMDPQRYDNAVLALAQLLESWHHSIEKRSQP